MRKPTLNFIVDSGAFVGFVALAATGALTRYVLPPGSGHGSTVWGLNRHGWGDVHFWSAVVLLTTLGLHVFLHWRWIVASIRGRPGTGSGRRLALGATAAVAVLALVAVPLFGPVRSATGERDRGGARREESAEGAADGIDGSMTLDEVSRRTGVTTGFLIRTLALPPETDTSERLGHLRRISGFHMGDVRRAVAEYGRQAGAK